ncbi:MAG: NHL repeat-containing protein [candidate division Zixibacteria bacterium]
MPIKRLQGRFWLFFTGATILFILSCGNEDDNMTNSPLESQWDISESPYNGGKLLVLDGFIGPYGITVASDGNIYVSDLKEGRVVRFNRNFRYTGWLGMNDSNSNSASGWHISGTPVRGTETGMFNMAHSVDFDARGNIFIADYLNGRIHKYSPQGQFLGLFFDPPSRPELAFDGCANGNFDRDFNLWVSDFNAHRVFKFGPDGSLIGWMGEYESGGLTSGFADTGQAKISYINGGLYKPHMVQCDEQGNIYIVETGNHRVQKFDSSGRFLGWIGARSGGGLTDGWETTGESVASDLPGGFSAPVSLQLVNDELMIITDNTNHRIQKFDIDGHFIGWLGGKPDSTVTTGWETSGQSGPGGDAPGMFLAPYDARLHGDTLYVADGHNGRIQVFILDNP